MNDQPDFLKRWTLASGITGLSAFAVYIALIVAPLPQFFTVLFAAAFGVLLSIASVGLYHLLKIFRKTVTLQAALMCNVVAGAIVNMMIVVQLTVRSFMRQDLDAAADESARQTLRWIWDAVDKVQLGLDVSWDVYIALGTFLFALNMLRHPRFGKIFGWAGMLITLLLLAFNLYTFPTPPGEANLVDLGPAVGLWYIAVGIQTLRSVKWVDNALRG